MSTNISLVSLTQAAFKIKNRTLSPEDLIVYEARRSNPKNQENLETGPGLLKYCIKNKHWSVFEMVDMTVSIKTSRAISAQILRHKSFSFQEFSQRYAEAQDFEIYNARRQDLKNRQNSVDDLPNEVNEQFLDAQQQVIFLSNKLYKEALDRGISKESARFLLPLSTTTSLYMKGSIRSWIHYLELRTGNGTQLEHQEIANEIKGIFIENFPATSEALGWTQYT